MLFRIKLSYKCANQQSGEVQRVKEEVIAECVNYTHAETFMEKLIKSRKMDAFDRPDYEIIREKFDVYDISMNDVLIKGDEIGGLYEYYFENETDALFMINVKIFDNEDKKDRTEIHYVPADNTIGAIKYLEEELAENGYKKDEYMIKKSSVDNASSLYLTSRKNN